MAHIKQLVDIVSNSSIGKVFTKAGSVSDDFTFPIGCPNFVNFKYDDGTSSCVAFVAETAEEFNNDKKIAGRFIAID